MNDSKRFSVYKEICSILKKDIEISFQDETCDFKIDAISKKEIATLKKSFDTDVIISSENNKVLVILDFDSQY